MQRTWWQEEKDKVPKILASNDFLIMDAERDALLRHYNSTNSKEQAIWRHALDTDMTDRFKFAMKQSILSDGNFLVAFSGRRRSGKSIAAITVLIWAYYLLLDFCGIRAVMDWQRNYAAVNKAVADAEKERRVILSLRDEEETLGGERSDIEKGIFRDLLSQTGILKHCFAMCDIEFDQSMKGLIDYHNRMVGYSKKWNASLGIVHDHENTPVGYIIIMMDASMMHIYDEYREWKLGKQHARTASGTMATAIESGQLDSFAEKILAKCIELFPKERKLKKDQFLRAHTATGGGLSTGDDRKEVWGRVRDAYAEFAAKRTPPPPPRKPASKEEEKTKKEVLSALIKKGKKAGDAFEDEFPVKYAGKLFGKFKMLNKDVNSRKKKSRPDGIAFQPTEYLRTFIDIPVDWQGKVIVGLEAGYHPSMPSFSVQMGEKGGEQGGRIHREIMFAQTCRDLEENVIMMVFYKEAGRGKVYPFLVDLNKPRTHTINFEEDKYFNAE